MRPLTLPVFSMVLLVGCWNFEVNTVEKWCEQISGVDLVEKYSPIWAGIPIITLNPEAIRDDFVNMLNSSLLEKVDNRTERMAWRENNDLHIENLSPPLMAIDPEVVISEWRQGIDRVKRHKSRNKDEYCLYGTTTSLFDHLFIHSWELDQEGEKLIARKITKINTDRQQRLKNPL